MQKFRTTTEPLVENKSRYHCPHIEQHSLHIPLSLLATMSESILNLEGDITNYDEGDEFY